MVHKLLRKSLIAVLHKQYVHHWLGIFKKLVHHNSQDVCKDYAGAGSSAPTGLIAQGISNSK
jgi:hypothetical protein